VSRTEPDRPLQHCPQGEVHTQGKCWCDPKKSFGELFLPAIVLYHAPVAYGVLDDRSRVVLLFEQIRCAIQVIVEVFQFRRVGSNTTADWTTTGAIGINSDKRDKLGHEGASGSPASQQQSLPEKTQRAAPLAETAGSVWLCCLAVKRKKKVRGSTPAEMADSKR